MVVIFGAEEERRRSRAAAEICRLRLLYVWLWLLSLFVCLQLVVYVKKYLYCRNTVTSSARESADEVPFVLLVSTDGPVQDARLRSLLYAAYSPRLRCSTGQSGQLLRLVRASDLTSALVLASRDHRLLRYVCVAGGEEGDQSERSFPVPMARVKQLLVSESNGDAAAERQACLKVKRCLVVAATGLGSDRLARELAAFLDASR